MDYTYNEKPIIEVFNEFALKTKRQIFYTENQLQETKLLQSAMTKRTLYIPDKNGEQIYLIGYHNPKALENNDLFFGSFFPLSISNEKKLSIRKRFFFDNLTPFKKETFKLDNHYFDSQTIIKGNDKNIVKAFLSHYSVQTAILDSLRLADDINVGINCVNIDFIPEFNNKSNFGIFTKSKWVTDFEALDILLKNIRKINSSLIGK
ncbi:MAG: hypothetical protein AB7S40_02195 [Bacteroidales bacterium]